MLTLTLTTFQEAIVNCFHILFIPVLAFAIVLALLIIALFFLAILVSWVFQLFGITFEWAHKDSDCNDSGDPYGY